MTINKADLHNQGNTIDSNFFDIIWQNSSDGLVLTDLQGVFMEVNPAYCKITGYESGELKGKRISDLIPPKEAESRKTFFSDLVKRKVEPGPLILSIIPKNGNQIFINTIMRFTEYNGRACILHQVQRFQEENLAKKAAEATQVKLISLLDQFPAIIFQFMIDKEGNHSIPYLSPNYIEKYKPAAEKEEVSDKDFPELHPDDREKFIETIAISAKNLSAWKHEFRLKVRGGGYRWFAGNSSPLLQKDGGILWNGLLMDIDEQRKTLNALEESEANLKAIFNNTLQMFMMVDEEYRIISLNNIFSAYYERILKKKVQPGDSLLDLVYPDHREDFRNNFARCLKGESVVVSRSLPFKDKMMYFIFNYNPVVEPDGQIHKIVFSVIDITEGKLAETKAREQEEKMRLFTESIDDVLWMTDQNLKLTYVSPGIKKMLGFTSEEFMALDYFASMHPNSIEKAKDVVDKRREINKLGQKDAVRKYFEFDFLHKDGHAIPVSVSTTPIYNPEQEFKGIVGIVSDRTEKKKAEKALKDSEAKYRFLTESTSELVCLHDPTGSYQYISPACEKLLGYLPEEFAQTAPRDLIHPEDVERVFQTCRENIEKHNQTPLLEFRVLHKNGEYIWLGTYLEVLKDDKGNLKGLISQSRNITEQKQAKEAIQRSEERFGMLANLTQEGIMIHKNGILIDVNEAFSRITGYSREELLHLDLVNTIADEKDWEVIRNNIRENYQQPYEVSAIRKDGSRFPVELIGRSIFYKGEQLRVVAIRDLSERKIAEKALAESEAKFRLLFQHMNEAFALHRIIFDEEGNIADVTFTEVNSVFEKYSGFNRAELIGKSTNHFFPPDNKELRNKFSDLVFNGKPLFFTFFYEKTNRYLEIRGYCPSPGYFASISSDITGRIKYQKELILAKEKSEENQRLFKSVFEQAEVGIVILGLDLNFIRVNQKFCDMLGYTRDEMLQMVFYQFTYPEDLTQDNEMIMEAVSGKKNNFKFEKRYIHKEGHLVWVNVYLSSVKDSAGNDLYYVAIVSDITERKKAEAALLLNEQKLKTQNEAYFKANQELSASHQKIMEINEQLKKANSELDSFVYRVSHDLRAPITSSLGLANLSKNTDDLKELKMYAQLQQESLLKLDNFIRDILNYSRNSRIEVNPEGIWFNELIHDILQEVQFNLNDAAVKVELSINQTKPFISDKFRLKVILQNLISNGIKFHNPYVQDRLLKIEVDHSPEFVAVNLKDNGIGIDQKHLGRIFEMFYRATDKKPGSGIGLYIVKDCLEKIRGNIEVDSAIGEGTTFKIILPALS